MKALLIIDMQKGCFNPYESRYDTAGVISRINELSDKFRKRNYPVIFIQHNGTSENELIPHTDDWKLLPELTTLPGDLFFDKTANDSFYRTELEDYLKASGINELYITGAATDFCIDVTVKSALNKDYKVTVISDCHTTEGKENLPAGVLINYYNWIWSALAPAKHKVSVIKAEEVIL
ncbi:MAG: cysteine hydrolase [Ignavibacteria bacterium]|nr:cysteine hydrolase [Ignavibacteria bacterium]